MRRAVITVNNPHRASVAGVYRRFWSKVQKSIGCWLWKATKNKQGYGRFGFNGHIDYAHRVAWALTFGAIPEDKLVLHKCDTPSCVNPLHLFLGTQKENVADCRRKGRRASYVGERNNVAVLNENDVRLIRRWGRRHSYASIGRLFGMTGEGVSLVCRRINWSHVR